MKIEDAKRQIGLLWSKRDRDRLTNLGCCILLRRTPERSSRIIKF